MCLLVHMPVAHDRSRYLTRLTHSPILTHYHIQNTVNGRLKILKEDCLPSASQLGVAIPWTRYMDPKSGKNFYYNGSTRCVCLCLRLCLCLCLCLCVRMCACVCICACIYIYTYIRMSQGDEPR
jgi:hypothetical protein